MTAMRIAACLWTVALCLGCGGTAEHTVDNPCSGVAPADGEPAADGKGPCVDLIGSANQAYADKRFDEALAGLDEAFDKCGDGHDILEMKALVTAVNGDADAAADILIEELIHAPASDGAYALAGQLLPRLSDAAAARLLGLGTTPDVALEPPSMKAEYVWAKEVVCRGEEPPTYGQGTMDHNGVTVELLTFDCPDGSAHDVYFLPPPDDLEEMFRERGID